MNLGKEFVSMCKNCESKVELKPCPFCGSEALIKQDQYSRSYVVCPQCDTRSAARFDAARAAAMWNRRV